MVAAVSHPAISPTAPSASNHPPSPSLDFNTGSVPVVVSRRANVFLIAEIMLQKPAGGPGIQVDVDANGALADQLKPEDHNDPGGGKIARF